MNTNWLTGKVDFIYTWRPINYSFIFKLIVPQLPRLHQRNLKNYSCSVLKLLGKISSKAKKWIYRPPFTTTLHTNKHPQRFHLTEPDRCHSMPCQNSGTCIQEITGTYKCQCAEGFRGYNCEGKYKANGAKNHSKENHKIQPKLIYFRGSTKKMLYFNRLCVLFILTTLRTVEAYHL